MHRGTHIFDHQMLCLLIPGDLVEELGKDSVHAAVAAMLSWSQQVLLEGRWPARDCDGNLYDQNSEFGRRAGATMKNRGCNKTCAVCMEPT